MAYLAAKAGLGLNRGSLVVFDTGGGSSQFTFGHDAVVDTRFSVNVGAVSYTERFGLDRAVSPEVLREVMAAISADLSRLDGHLVPDALAGMGGAVTNITAVMHRLATYDPVVVQGSIVDRGELDRQIERCGCPSSHRRPAAEACGGDPRRSLRGANDNGETGQGQFHRQRSRSASRRAGRAFRRLNVALLAMRKVLAIEPNGLLNAAKGMSS